MTSQRIATNDGFTTGVNKRLYGRGKDSFLYNPNSKVHSLETIPCACGCGELIYKYDTRGERVYFKGFHQYQKGSKAWGYKPELAKHKGEMIKCACGCGELIPRYDDRNTEHRFKENHHLDWLHSKLKGVLQGIRTPDNKLTSDRERRRRAGYYYFKVWQKEAVCYFSNELCSKSLGIGFLDYNLNNFSEDNIICVCRAHQLMRALNNLTWNDLYDFRPKRSRKKTNNETLRKNANTQYAIEGAW